MSGRVRLTPQEKKDALLAGLAEVRRQILAAAAALPGEKQDRVFLGSWTVKELLAHLQGWDLANLEGVQAILAGRLPEFYAHIDKDWRTFNARLVDRYKQEDYAQLITCAGDTHRQLLTFLESIPAEEFSKDRGVRYKGYRVIVARNLQSELDDEREHLRQVVGLLEE